MAFAGKVLRPLSEIAVVDQETINAIAAQVPPGGLTINEIKADADLASAISLKHNLQDISGLQPKETGKGLSTNDFLDTEQTKLLNIEENAAAAYSGGTTGTVPFALLDSVS